MNIRPYLSIDIETTGVDIEHVEILELGCVIDDGVSKLEDLEVHNWVIHHDFFRYSEPYAMAMNIDLIKSIRDKKNTEDPGDVFITFYNVMEQCSKLAYEWDIKNGVNRPSDRIQLCGKNISGFDKPILNKFFKELFENDYSLEDEWTGWDEDLLQHRTKDVGSMYDVHFGYTPNLNQINELIGYKEVAHRAGYDALNNVAAVRWLYEQR